MEKKIVKTCQDIFIRVLSKFMTMSIEVPFRYIIKITAIDVPFYGVDIHFEQSRQYNTYV